MLYTNRIRTLSALVLCLLFNVEKSTAQLRCGPILSADQVPASFRIDLSFYKKYLAGPGGIPIIGSSKVQDEALYR